jgi:hypothetical protein
LQTVTESNGDNIFSLELLGLMVYMTLAIYEVYDRKQQEIEADLNYIISFFAASFIFVSVRQ